MSISHAVDSIGLKEIPRYEVKINEDDEWMKKSQVNLLLFFCSSSFPMFVAHVTWEIKSNVYANSLSNEVLLYCIKSTFSLPSSLCSAIYVAKFVMRSMSFFSFLFLFEEG